MTIEVGGKVALQNIPHYLRISDGDEGIVEAISNDPVQPYHVRIDGRIWTFPKYELKEIKAE